MKSSDKPLFNTRDLADILGVSTNFIRQQVKDGKLHATTNIQRGSRTLLRFSLNDVLNYDEDAADRLAENAVA
jgi:hypothetical protein